MTDGFLRLTHSSVRDFLIRSEDQWVRESEVICFKVNVTEVHRSFSWVCLDYMRTEKDLALEPTSTTSESIRLLRESYPFLEYATLYTFYHLNRSGPPCSATVAKVEGILESRQSIVWLETFGHLQFEDLTLSSQVDEFQEFVDCTTVAGLDRKFSAIIGRNLRNSASQTYNFGKNGESYTEQLNMFLDLATDGQLGASGQAQSNVSPDPNNEPSKLGAEHQTQCLSTGPSSYDPSTTISRVKDLLKG